MRKVHLIMRVVDRVRHTNATLETLSKTNKSKDYEICGDIIFTPTQLFNESRLREMLKKHKLENWKVSVVPNMPAIENITYELSLYFYRKYIERHGEGAWCCLVENDVLFNPNWLEVMFRTIEEAEASGLCIGLAVPYHINGFHKVYRGVAADIHGTDYENAVEGYYVNKHIPGCAMLISPEAVELFAVKDEYFQMDIAIDWRICDKIRRFGFDVISLNPSVAQHIGITGMRTTNPSVCKRSWINTGRGGVGFVPGVKIKDLWKEFNRI